MKGLRVIETMSLAIKKTRMTIGKGTIGKGIKLLTIELPTLRTANPAIKGDVPEDPGAPVDRAARVEVPQVGVQGAAVLAADPR